MDLYNAEVRRGENPLGEWIRENRLKKGWNQKKLSEELKRYGVAVSFGSLSKWEMGDHMPTPYQMAALALAMDATSPMDAILPNEELFALNEEGQQKLNAYFDDLRASGRYTRVRSILMKVYTQAASAGTGDYLQDAPYDMVSVPKDTVPEEAEFGVRVEGDSMEPDFHDGQIAWVKPQQTLRSGEVGIFVLDGEAFIKELGYTIPETGIMPCPVLISRNSAYAPRMVDPLQSLRVVGKVVTV